MIIIYFSENAKDGVVFKGFIQNIEIRKIKFEKD